MLFSYLLFLNLVLSLFLFYDGNGFLLLYTLSFKFGNLGFLFSLLFEEFRLSTFKFLLLLLQLLDVSRCHLLLVLDS